MAVVAEWTCTVCEEEGRFTPLRFTSLAALRAAILRHVLEAHPGVATDSAAVNAAVDRTLNELLRRPPDTLTAYDRRFLGELKVVY